MLDRMQYDGWAHQAASEQAKRYHAAIEQACEQALQRGDCGVFVHWQDDGSLIVGPHPLVTYGRKVEVSGTLSHDFWANYLASVEDGTHE